ncbi:hypothetical protein HOY82DRAFT_563898 [Tuber indicum]|nr:hypothetical protein HOY82DRAFT_563898 [Tuber indicum]
MAEEKLAIIWKALEAHHPKFLIFTDLDREIALQILGVLERQKYKFDRSGFRLHYSTPDRYLRLVLPTMLQECPVDWMINERITWSGEGRLDWSHSNKVMTSKPTFDNFTGDYAGSTKTPDLAWTPRINGMLTDYPSVVLESGFMESIIQMMNDGRVWLQGASGAVRVVVFCKTSAPDQDKKIKATLTICRITLDGGMISTGWEVFPVPDRDQPDPYITMDELFGGNTPVGLDPCTQLPLSLHRLREMLGDTIRHTGRFPA